MRNRANSCILFVLFMSGCGDTIHHMHEAEPWDLDQATLDSNSTDCRYQRGACADGHECILVNTNYACVSVSLLAQHSGQDSRDVTDGDTSSTQDLSVAGLPRQHKVSVSSNRNQTQSTSASQAALNDHEAPAGGVPESAAVDSNQYQDQESDDDVEKTENNEGDQANTASPPSPDANVADQQEPRSEPQPQPEPQPESEPESDPQLQPQRADHLPIAPGRPIANFSYRRAFDQDGDELGGFSFTEFQQDDALWGEYEYMIVMLGGSFCPACEQWLAAVHEFHWAFEERKTLFGSILLVNEQHQPASSAESDRYSRRHGHQGRIISLGEADSSHALPWEHRFGEQGIRAYPTFVVIRRADGMVVNMSFQMNSLDALMDSVDQHPYVGDLLDQ